MCHNWLTNFKILLTIISLDGLLATRAGIYSIRRPPNAPRPGEDPCKPLYWYPREVPEYCHYRKDIIPKPDSGADQPPIPMPIPVPLPYPPPMAPPPPILPPPPMPPPLPMPMPPPLVNPYLPAIYSLPFGIPLAPANPMLPIAGIPLPPQPVYPPPPPPQKPPIPPFPSPFASYVPPYGIQRRRMSMVPGLPGLVSPDGGVNILPFSDAYADLLEKHKQKMIRRRLQKLLDEYDRYPWNSSHEDTRRMNTKKVIRNDIDVEANQVV